MVGDKKQKIRTRNGRYRWVQIYFTGFEEKHKQERKYSVLIWTDYLGKQLNGL